MKQNNHKHQALIELWANDKSTEFELAYGTGVDFVWVDCGINEVVNNESAQIRIKRKKPKKEKRLIVFRNDTVYGPYNKLDDINEDFKSTGQILEIEVEI